MYFDIKRGDKINFLPFLGYAHFNKNKFSEPYISYESHNSYKSYKSYESYESKKYFQNMTNVIFCKIAFSYFCIGGNNGKENSNNR